MASVSKIVIIGNVGRDPELRMTPNGRPVCEFSVAVNRVTGKAEDRQEQTDWYRVSCWSSLAERAQQMITKGRLVYVEGRFTPRTYTDKEGKERLSLDISANDFQMLDPRRDREGGMGGDAAVGAAPARGADGDKGFDPDEIPF
jgi:single-strand DNA-binding protein